MKKTRFFALLLVVVLSVFAFGVSAEIEVVRKVDKGSVVISELNNPAVFDFVIYNGGSEENIEIYSLISVSMTPRGKFSLAEGQTTIEVTATPDEIIRSRTGFFNFEYQIKGDVSGIIKDNLLIKIVDLADVLEIEPGPLHPSSSQATVIIRNKENTHLENVKIDFDSPFFSGTQTVSLGPFEEVEVNLTVNKDKEKIVAGAYIVSANINVKDEETKIEGIIDYLESSGTSVDESTKGIIIKETTITKTNQGNTPTEATIEVEKDIISRLFTSMSLEADSIERNGLMMKYLWTRNLNPGESFTIQTTTNYTIPFILIILIVAVGVLAKVYSQTAVVLKKRVAYVKTKGGQFALKVNIHVKAKKHVDNVQLIDVLPRMTKLYENFGKKPDKIDKASKRVYWNIDKLSAGEERVYSYIIYSDLTIVGRFELPATTAVYEKDGKTAESWSNRTYFVAETNKVD